MDGVGASPSHIQRCHLVTEENSEALQRWGGMERTSPPVPSPEGTAEIIHRDHGRTGIPRVHRGNADAKCPLSSYRPSVVPEGT
jgi:hypothetical protein